MCTLLAVWPMSSSPRGSLGRAGLPCSPCGSLCSSAYSPTHVPTRSLTARRRLQGLPAPRRRRRRRRRLLAALHLPGRRRASPPAAAAAATAAAAARAPTVAAAAARLTAVHGLVACRGRTTGRHSAVRDVCRGPASRVLRLSAACAARGEGEYVKEVLGLSTRVAEGDPRI